VTGRAGLPTVASGRVRVLVARWAGLRAVASGRVRAVVRAGLPAGRVVVGRAS
jgi:hypothetical protein